MVLLQREWGFHAYYHLVGNIHEHLKPTLIQIKLHGLDYDHL
jgi:hypothetical protein